MDVGSVGGTYASLQTYDLCRLTFDCWSGQAKYAKGVSAVLLRRA